ncbi:succinate dehydrogenase, cytochrome b556 subunit [Anaplasma bovis]|uniref:succinate dehydrogenase, cytochrome b556 subunit n=1 Tax=Anaplasma bovis TaxID=186733 RepID=UPI002FF2A518
MAPKTRPLSPHLGVYRLPFTAWLSIAHRATGVLVFAGVVLFSWIMVLLGFFPDFSVRLLESPLVHYFLRFVLVGWSGTMCYHYCNGVRHLFWDCGIGFSKSAATWSGCVMLGAAGLACLVLLVLWLLG